MEQKREMQWTLGSQGVYRDTKVRFCCWRFSRGGLAKKLHQKVLVSGSVLGV